MSYQVLSRKWRPKTFGEVVGQRHVTESLQKSIIANRLGHAYVLTGTRGIGKTSIARIFAKSVRCLNRKSDGNPCETCRSCLEFDQSSSMNILEMDGASNNKVEDIRDLIGTIQTLPTYGEYKVYIIDEVHMLSVAAFNALLKTLEEPPEHVIFLMATTEPHKIPDTVLSRCQRFDFRNASIELIEMHLREISEKENIVFESNMIPNLIASQAKGSFRDALSLLDQVLSFSDDLNVSEESVSLALGLAKLSTVRMLSFSILTEDVETISTIYKELLFSNVKLENITKSLLDTFYDIIKNIDMLGEVGFDEKEQAALSDITIDELYWLYEGMCKDFSWVIDSVAPEKSLEIVLQKYALRSELLKRGADQATKPLKKKTKIIVKEKTWEDFEKVIESDSPAIAAQLFHGNLIRNPAITSSSVSVAYGFSEKSYLFFDHLTQEGAKEKLEAMMSSFFDKEKATVEFIKIKKEKENFQSKAEIIEEEIQNNNKARLNNFKNHPIVKEAEKIFNTTLDKVNLKE